MLKKALRISIIIPAYNEQHNLPRLLKSIKNQSYKNHEVIVIDDASTDKTAQYALKYTKHVYRRSHAERSVQRNFGAKKATGGFLLFLDADMELTKNVLKDCVEIIKKKNPAMVTIPERTVGKGFLSSVRKFEREMYMGDASIEVPRLFKRSVFFEFDGYDPALTGPEDYDLPYRISKKYATLRAHEYILHYEENISLLRLLKRKHYYASRGALYAKKHPELIAQQGTILFRKAYVKSWRKFIAHPILGVSFIIIRLLETAAAVLGFIQAVGLKEFLKSLYRVFI